MFSGVRHFKAKKLLLKIAVHLLNVHTICLSICVSGHFSFILLMIRILCFGLLCFVFAGFANSVLSLMFICGWLDLSEWVEKQV